MSKAKQGKDPNAQPGAVADPSQINKSSALRHNDPAVILGGALKDAAGANPVTPSVSTSPTQLVNKLI